MRCNRSNGRIERIGDSSNASGIHENLANGISSVSHDSGNGTIGNGSKARSGQAQISNGIHDFSSGKHFPPGHEPLKQVSQSGCMNGLIAHVRGGGAVEFNESGNMHLQNLPLILIACP